VAGSRSGFCISVASELDTSPASPLTPAVLLQGDLSVCEHAGGSAECGAPSGAAVKTSLSRAWSAARALPRHACQVCTWASGELLLLLFTFCSSYWPWSLTILVKTSEPSSQILLCVAAAGCMLVSVSYDCAISCDNLLAPLLPLSAHLLTEVLF
jgi:hypothetical protein